MDPRKEKKITERLSADERETLMLTGLVRERVYGFLIGEKRYGEEDIEIDAPVTVADGERQEACSVDFIVRAGGKRLIAIKCAPGSLESRERHILAFSRVAGQIPISVVTNFMGSRVLETASGELVSEELSSIPDSQEAQLLAGEIDSKAYPEERLRRETLILLAFNALQCPIPEACPPETCLPNGGQT